MSNSWKNLLLINKIRNLDWQNILLLINTKLLAIITNSISQLWPEKNFFILCGARKTFFYIHFQFSVWHKKNIFILFFFMLATLQNLPTTCQNVKKFTQQKKHQCHQQVRAETISTMRVIGKFIGFVVSRSFSYDGYRNSLVDQKQMNIRNFVSIFSTFFLSLKPKKL